MKDKKLISEAIFELLDEITDIVYVLKKDESSGKFLKVYVNKRLLEITNLKYKDILGKPHKEFLPEEIAKFCESSNKDIEKTKKPFKAIREFTYKGKRYFFDFTKIPILDKNKNLVAVAGWAKDITDLVSLNKREKSLNRKLVNILEKDQTTGVLNKTSLEKIIKNFSKKDRPISLIIFDIDNFRFINQLYGFKTGDFLLKSIAEIIKKSAKNFVKKPVVARVGNDQIALLFTCSNIDFTLAIAEKLKTILEETEFDIKNLKISLTFTVAIYSQCINKEKKPPQFILSDLEITLLRAKEKGKSEIIIYDEKLDSKERFKAFFEEKRLILDAIKNRKFLPFLHPIYDTKTNKVFAYEVLVRIEENGKYISPAMFLDTAIKSGLISQIDRILLEETIKFAKKIDKKLFFNISAISLEKNLDIVEFISKGVENIVFEITEQVAVSNSDIIEKLVKKANAKFAIDDFGTGYASLKFVVELALLNIIEVLKIDGSMIKDISKNESNRKIVHTIVNLAKDLNLKTVAEFVEDKITLDIIKNLGVDFAQGYYFTPPRIYREFLDEAV